MTLDRKLTALDNIYAVYDEFAAGLDLACRKFCARCCTRDVTLTTLEGLKILGALTRKKKRQLLQLLEGEQRHKRFQPKITINKIAERCARGQALPEEETRGEGQCPLLDENLCRIYGIRPFGCRCFVSKVRCDDSGYADVDAVVLTVNNIFLQTMEHLDRHGCSGNLSDVLLGLSSGENERCCRDGKIDCEKTGLIKNQAMTVLMIPPDHREKVEQILNQLRRISV